VLLYSLRRFFVGPYMQDSAARWPYLTGLATAADKYEESPHGAATLSKPAARVPVGFYNFSHPEMPFYQLDRPAAFERLGT
jgi:hypothetical protein